MASDGDEKTPNGGETGRSYIDKLEEGDGGDIEKTNHKKIKGKISLRLFRYVLLQVVCLQSKKFYFL